MKFAVVGGDRRSALLSAMLAQDGHRVHSFALERAELPSEIPKTGCLEGCVYGADCVVLPVPAERGGRLFAPLASEEQTMERVIGALWPGQLLCGGAFSRESSLEAIRAGLSVRDLTQCRSFTVGNAAVTAEGAIELLMKSSARTLWRSRILVTGWGRVAKLVALRLGALGARVTVAARKEGDRAMASALGFGAMDFKRPEGAPEPFDFLVNTVPAPVIGGELLSLLREDALLLELASPPGGFDRAAAEQAGLRTLSAPGLPGICAPYTAAELMQAAIFDVLREREE